MIYVFLIAAIWNLWGGINFLFSPEKQAKNMNYPIGNRWESQYIAILAFVLCAIYVMIFFYQPTGYLIFVPFFAVAKLLIGISAMYCYRKHKMPLPFSIAFGGGNFIIGALFTLYLFLN
ncbi:MAG: hypothetical protein GY760_14595 [Deltaproteobacteria bacterium]|nr:hypothetical protein [Deltaproteobacteria bacterium]